MRRTVLIIDEDAMSDQEIKKAEGYGFVILRKKVGRTVLIVAEGEVDLREDQDRHRRRVRL